MGSWGAELLSAESAALLAFVAVTLLVYLATKVHLESKQNTKDHADLRKAIDRQAEAIDRQAESTDRRFDATDRRFDATDRRFDSTDRKLDQILGYLLQKRSGKDD